jgi:hypothetical protein
MKNFLGFSFLVVFVASSANAADGYQTWVENMTCGNVEYRIESVCKPSKEPMEANVCKSQALFSKKDGVSKSIALPDLPAKRLLEYKKAKIKPDLFVVSWQCLDLKNSKILGLYYSNGGHSDFSEDFVIYDSNGILMNEDDPRSKGVFDIWLNEKDKPVRSFMPN